MEKRVINICDVCEEIFAGGDAPKDRFSETKTDDFSVPIYSNGEANSGLYGYTNFSRVNVPSITVSARGTIGYTTIRHEPFVPIVRLITLVPKTDVIDINYLYYATQNYKFVNNGTSIPQLTVPMLKRYSFPLPSMEQQKKIADEFDKVTVLIDKRKKQLEKFDELVKSRFIEMFGGIHDSKMYPYKMVKELTEVISGGTPSRDVSEYWEEGTIPWVKTTELQNNVVTKVEEHITEKGLNNSSAKIVPVGTVLVAMYGQGKTRGMTAYLEIKACTNQACACILPSGKINQKFLWYFFILSYDNLRDLAKGGNQPNLNGNMIKTYPILYPPIELQNQFAAFVEQVDKSKLEVQKSLEKLELLKKALMKKYFH